jgi:transposase
MEMYRLLADANLRTSTSYSVLPALAIHGMVYSHIVEGSFTASRFIDFIHGLLDHLQPYPAPNSVIVMDNCRIHKAPEIQEMIEARCAVPNERTIVYLRLSRGMRLEFLPTYSPDFNPIEQAFSAIKAYIRRHYRHFARSNVSGTDPHDDAEVYMMLNEAVYSITSHDAIGFFHHSGYL